MNIDKLIEQVKKPSLYESGTSIMWTDPHISRQLLDLHTNPDNDMASRSSEKIELIVEWILSKVKKDQMDILDLGCGPGLYAEKFAQSGHHVTGVDFSRTSIDYAKGKTEKNCSGIKYYCDNYLNIDFENRFDLVILIYLDFCVLKPDERKIVLDNIYKALKHGGRFIFDVVNGKNMEAKILKPSWEVCMKGFWKDEPYIVLNKGYHYPEDKVLANQHIVINQKNEIESYLFWSAYYEYEELEPILKESRFQKIRHFDNVLPKGDAWNGDNVTFYIAEK
jgi:SAM-dependent methyltransferase